MAQRRHELPLVFEAFGAGELAEDQVAVLVGYLPAHNDADGVALAKELAVPVLRRRLRDYPFQPAADEAPEDERRSVSFCFRDEGTFALSATLPADEGALVERALGKARDELVEDHTPGAERVTWADALVHLSETSLGGSCAPAAERHQVVVHVRGDRPGRDASLHLGPALPASIRRYRSCDATLRLLLEDDADARTGRVLTGLAGPGPPAAPPAEAARALGVADASWVHPSGERLDRRWVEFAPAGART
jgi:hypothetical protein